MSLLTTAFIKSIVALVEERRREGREGAVSGGWKVRAKRYA